MAIFTAAAAWVATTFAVSTAFATFVVSTAVSMGLSALSQVLSGKKGPQKQQFGVKGTLERGAAIPQSFILGNYATAGSLTYANTAQGPSSAANSWMTWIVTLSDLPVSGFSGMWVNGSRMTLTKTGGNEYVVENYAVGVGPHMIVNFYDGTQTAADGWTVTQMSTAARPWDSSAIGKGKAYAVVRMHVHPTAWNGKFPEILFETKGIPLYNPAKDTSVGGSGAHRWADKATWESSENPAVQLYNILRGIYYEGDWFYGLQDVSEAQLPVGHWIGQINKCAATIQGADGPEPLFRSSAEIPVSAEIYTAIESLLDACNGRLSDAGGVYKLFAGAPEAPSMTFADADIISTKEQTFTPFLGLADTVNGVTAKYPSPAAGWQVETAPPLYCPDYETEDGGRRLLVDVNLDFVPYAEQAQRLMKAALNEARRARRHTLTMPPEFWQLEPGDVVSWTSERNGYVAKQFRVDGIVDGPDADVVLDLTEVDSADYVFDTAEDFTPPAIPSTEPQPVEPQQVLGFMVYPHELSDAGGIDRRPAILVAWDGGNDIADGVQSTQFQIRVKATGELIPSARTDDVADGQLVIEQGILPATEYEVRAKHIPRGPIPSDWTIWRSVTTPDIRYGYGDLDQQIQDDINDMAANAGIPTYTTLPAAGEKPNQIVLKMPEAVLYRWDAEVSQWVTSLYAGIPDGSIDVDKFSAGLTPVEVVAALPASDNFKGRVVFLESDGKLYRHQGAPVGAAGFSAAVPSADISGTITNAQIAGIDAGKVTGQLTNTQIADLASAKLTGSITSAQIGGLEAGKISGQLTDAQIAGVAAAKVSGQLTDSQIAGIGAAKLTGQITETQITNNAITTAKIKAGAVTADEIAAGSVIAGRIATNAITAVKISAGSVETAKIATEAVIADKIGANAVTAAKISAGAVEADKIKANAVIASKIATDAVTAIKISAGAVETDKLAAGSVVADKIATNAITAAKISAGAVLTAKLAAGSVEASKIAAGAVTADKIGANAVTAVKIDANAVTAGKIAAGAVVADKIGANAVTSEKIAAGSITADKIEAGAITSDAIAAGAIIASKIGAGEVTTPALAAGAAKVGNIEIDNQLVISAKRGAFVMGKDSAYSEALDGIYMGRTEEPGNVTGFGFSVSKTSDDGTVQSLSATYDDGLKLRNAKFSRDLAPQVNPNFYTSSQTITIEPNVLFLDIEAIGGGGGGATGRTHAQGTDGGDTVITLKDGSTTIQSITASGGQRGIGPGDYYANGKNGESSVWGAGGAGGAPTGNHYEGKNATGFGAGGGGGAASSGAGADSGDAGQFISNVTWDVRGLAAPKLVVTVGVGGTGGPSHHNVGGGGGNGSPGRLRVIHRKSSPTPADVIPLESTQWGNMPRKGPFPDLGAGLWTLSAVDYGTLDMGFIRNQSGKPSINARAVTIITFVSNHTPNFTTNDNNAGDVRYQFYKMGQ